MQVGGVAHRGDVARSVPRRADAVHGGHGRDVAGRRDAAHLADVHAQEVDEPTLDQGQPFGGVVEELPHGDGRGGGLAHAAEPLVVLGRQGVFEEEQVEGFELLREDDGVGGREPLVGVVEQFHLAAHGRAQVLEHPDRAAHVAPRIEIVAGFRALGRRDPRLPAPVSADLAAHVPVVLGHVPQDVLRHFLGRCAVGVDVRVRRLPALSAEELVHGHARPFPLDVPQRHVHAGDRVVQDRAVAPVAVHHGRLPQVLDIVRVLADEEGFQVVFDGGVDGPEPLGECGAAQAVEAGFGGQELDDDQARTGRLGQDGPDVGDGHGHGCFPSERDVWFAVGLAQRRGVLIRSAPGGAWHAPGRRLFPA